MKSLKCVCMYALHLMGVRTHLMDAAVYKLDDQQTKCNPVPIYTLLTAPCQQPSWARRFCTILAQSPSQDFFTCPRLRGLQPKSSLTQKVPNLSLTQSDGYHHTYVPGGFLPYFPFCSLASLSVHSFFPLLSIWCVVTDETVSFPKPFTYFGVQSPPPAQDSVSKQAQWSQSLSLASYKDHISRTADPNLFPEDTMHFPYSCL